jgi:tetratricopeptide (TPR) repeat protein
MKLAVQLDPSLEEAHGSLEKLSAGLNDPKEASLLRLAESGQSEDLLRLGLYYFEQGRYPAAIKQFEQLRIRQFHENETLKVLATAYLMNGKPKEGIDCLRYLAERNPGDPQILANLAFAYFDMGNFEGAEKTFLQAQSANPDSKLVHYGLGLIYRYSNRLPQAYSEFRKFLAGEDPQSTWYKEAQSQVEQIDALLKNR